MTSRQPSRSCKTDPYATSTMNTKALGYGVLSSTVHLWLSPKPRAATFEGLVSRPASTKVIGLGFYRFCRAKVPTCELVAPSTALKYRDGGKGSFFQLFDVHPKKAADTSIVARKKYQSIVFALTVDCFGLSLYFRCFCHQSHFGTCLAPVSRMLDMSVKSVDEKELLRKRVGFVCRVRDRLTVSF